MKLKTLNTVLLAVAIGYLVYQLIDIEMRLDRINQIIDSGQLKCTKPK